MTGSCEARTIATRSSDDLVVHAIYSVEGGRAATETLLERGVTGVVCGSDLMALGAIRAVRARGLRVPEDVSAVGFDDSLLLPHTDPPLTTVRQHVEAMSRHAVSALVEEISGAPQPRRKCFSQSSSSCAARQRHRDDLAGSPRDNPDDAQRYRGARQP